MSYLTDAMRRAATSPDAVTDLPGLLVAAACALDRFETDHARATGQPSGAVREARGLGDPGGQKVRERHVSDDGRYPWPPPARPHEEGTP